jgi:hypothetical protein
MLHLKNRKLQLFARFPQIRFLNKNLEFFPFFLHNIIRNSDTEVAGQDEVLWIFGGVRWVSRQNPELQEFLTRKL